MLSKRYAINTGVILILEAFSLNRDFAVVKWKAYHADRFLLPNLEREGELYVFIPSIPRNQSDVN